jgi:hypothetical protein
VGKGYAEGPAVEAAEEARDAKPAVGARLMRRAVQGSTRDDPNPHFIGWADEVDADELFRSGAAWGVRVVELAADAT